jgi:hypothetical protein
MSLRFFNVRAGSPRLLGTSSLNPQKLSGPVGQTLAFICRCSMRVVPWEKCIHPPSDLYAVARYRPAWGVAAPAHVPNWESLKVIALDKNGVNSNLSSGKQSPQISPIQLLIVQKLVA